MNRRALVAAVVSLAFGAACERATIVRPIADAGATRDAGEQERDGGGICALSPRAGERAGASCGESASCGGRLECEPERSDVAIPTRLPDGQPGPAIALGLWPGSVCTRTCDPARERLSVVGGVVREGDSRCGECAQCSDTLPLGPGFGVQLRSPTDPNPGLCFQRCSPTLSDNGGCREGWSCAVAQRVCVPACRDDLICKVRIEDLDGDQRLDLVFDPGETTVCDRTTGRCVRPPRRDGAVGSACTRDDECGRDGECLQAPGFPNGFCTRVHCDVPAFACPGENTVCDLRRRLTVDASSCGIGCVVGAEPASDRLGPSGRGFGCPPNWGCFFRGGDEPERGFDGVCLPANYNEIAEPNLGARCLEDRECWSPYGYGTCLRSPGLEEGPGFCSVANCTFDPEEEPSSIEPGIGWIDVCPGSQNVCVTLRGGPVLQPWCIRTCESGNDCDRDIACSLSINLGEGGVKNGCFTFCESDAQCRDDQACRPPGRTSPCPASGLCRCTDR